MKKIIFLVLTLTLCHSAFSQEWKRIKVDNALSILVNGKISRDSSERDLVVKCETSAGKFTIDKVILPDSITKSNGKADGLEYFVKGYLAGLKDRIDLLENKPATIDGSKARTVIYRDQSRQIVQISFIHLKDRIYRLRLTQTSAAFDEDRLKIFDSVKVLKSLTAP